VGLRIMRERAARIGGAVTVQSRPGNGTEVALHVPFARPVDAEPGEKKVA
jgi:nitrate/nitrite-specific signal transduction histidine kinase